MIALKIEDLKSFTKELFVGELFDGFLIREATIVTYNSFTIDGHIREGYFSDEELEEKQIEELSSWNMIKPICFSLIKGKKLPGSFQIIMQLSPGKVDAFLKSQAIPMTGDQIQGLCMNIRYEDGRLSCVTATSLSLFTMDKTLEREWDEFVRRFFQKSGIDVTEE